MYEVRQSAARKKTWLIVIFLASILIAWQYLIRRLKPSLKEKQTETEGLQENQEVPARIIGLTEEEAASKQGDTINYFYMVDKLDIEINQGNISSVR